MRPIDADELLTAFPVDDEPTLTKSCVRMTIQHMPTIEPRKGKWSKEMIGATPYKYCCSKCNKYSRAMYDYCPNCGADMRGREDEQSENNT